jgi:hypothetical protein
MIYRNHSERPRPNYCKRTYYYVVHCLLYAQVLLYSGSKYPNGEGVGEDVNATAYIIKDGTIEDVKFLE